LSRIGHDTNEQFSYLHRHLQREYGRAAVRPVFCGSFFAPVKIAIDFFSDPQLYYDVMRDHWIVCWLEVDPSVTFHYLEVAIGVTNSPTQPSSGAQYYIYQFATSCESSGPTPSTCDYQTAGNDTWTLDFTCVNFRGNSSVGNTIISLYTIPSLTGGAAPAFRLRPAIEEGMQDVEFFVSTDAGYGGPSQNLSIRLSS
jgi:hypothetical protein